MHLKRTQPFYIILLIVAFTFSIHIANAQWNTNGNGIHYNGGYVGIGYNNPQYKLHISGTSSSNVIAEFNKNGSGAQNPIIRLASNSTSGLTLGHQTNFKEAYINHSYGSATKLYFRLRGNTKMTIRNDGNVGIGTTTPDSKLTVKGKIHAREVKVTATAGADFVFAEGYAPYPGRSGKLCKNPPTPARNPFC